MLLLILIAIGIWFWVGDPMQDTAGWLYPNEAAPWETVDAYYYPNRSNMSDYRIQKNLSDPSACRDWVYQMAAMNRDPSLIRGDYECGVGKPKSKYGLNVYRITIK